MLFQDKSKRHQYLTQYLRQAAKRKVRTNDSSLVGPLAVAAACFAATGAMFAAGPMVILSLAMLVMAGFVWQQGKKREPDARERLIMEARPVVTSMLAHADQKRLHRELDEATVSLLEECARYYWQVRSVFESSFWAGPSLPVSYQGIRESALKAADMTMDELMLLYANTLPNSPQGSRQIEFVEDVLEEFVFKKPRAPDFIPPTFEPTRRIAEKLRELAAEADRVSHALVTEPNVPSITNPGSALDASIGDLRQIRQAEEELQQTQGL